MILAMIPVFIKQLESYRSPLKTKEESDYLEADIRGYKMIQESNSPENARNFVAYKNLLKSDGSFENNEKTVLMMKETGAWK